MICTIVSYKQHNDICRYDTDTHDIQPVTHLLTSITYNRLITDNVQNDHGRYGIYIKNFKTQSGIDLCTMYTKSPQHCGARDRFRCQRVPLKHSMNRYFGNEGDDITCEQCREDEPDTDETIDHVLLQCSMYHNLRQQLIYELNLVIPNTVLSIELLLMSDNNINNMHMRKRQKMCALTGKYLVDVLHTRTRAIYHSMQEQANEQNEQTQPASVDPQSTQSAVVQHNTQPIANRTRSRHVIH